jgi:hypothetical protein
MPSIGCLGETVVILIGYPRCATTSIEQLMRDQGLRVAHASLLDLKAGIDADFIRAESVVDCVRISDEPEWQRNLYTPGVWPSGSTIDDPDAIATDIGECYPNAKVLIVTRDLEDWLKSVHRYCMRELPLFRRSFHDYMETPSGRSHWLAGKSQGAIIRAYQKRFETLVLSYEVLRQSPLAFASQLCAFCGVTLGTVPQSNASSVPLLPLPTRRRVNAWIRAVTKSELI